MRRVHPTIGYFVTLHAALAIAVGAAWWAARTEAEPIIPADSVLAFESQRFEDGSRMTDLLLGELHESTSARVTVVEEDGRVVAVAFFAPTSTAAWSFRRSDLAGGGWLASFTAFTDDDGVVQARSGTQRIRILDDDGDGWPDRRLVSRDGRVDELWSLGWGVPKVDAMVGPMPSPTD